MSLVSLDVRHWNLPLVVTAALGLACGPTIDPTVGETETDTNSSSSSATTYGYYDDDSYPCGTGGCCYYDDCCYGECYDTDTGGGCGFDFCFGAGEICVNDTTCLYTEVLPECESELSVVSLDLPLDEAHPILSLAFVEADGDPGSELVVGRLGRTELYLGPEPMPVELPWEGPEPVLDAVSADFDGDGDLDLAMPTVTMGLLLLTNDGNGIYTATIDPAVALSTLSLEVLDWNGDGVPDLAGVDENGQATLLLGNGMSGFEPPLLLLPPLGEIRSLAAGRFDGDALDDLAASDVGNATAVYQGNAEGDLEGDVALLSNADRERLLLSGAIGGGGGDEILGYPTPTGPPGLLELWSDAMGEPRYYSFDGGVDRAAVGDLDGDGSDDLMVSDAPSLRYVAGGSDGEQAVLSCIGSYSRVGPGSLAAMAVGDLDGNGRADVAYASDGVVTVLLTQ